MSQRKVTTLSYTIKVCGKRMKDSKKQYQWKFCTYLGEYCLILKNSYISGKRVITLNGHQVYSEKSLLNLQFHYNEVIDGHCVSISRIPHSMYEYQCKIDNQPFQELSKQYIQGSESKQKSLKKEGLASNNDQYQFQKLTNLEENSQDELQIETQVKYSSFSDRKSLKQNKKEGRKLLQKGGEENKRTQQFIN